MKLSESQLRSIIRQELQEMMTPEFGESGERTQDALKQRHGSNLGFKFTEEADEQSEILKTEIIQLVKKIKESGLKTNVASLVRSEGQYELAKFLQTLE